MTTEVAGTVVIISGKGPGRHDSVGDNGWLLARQLAKRGRVVLAVPDGEEAVHPDGVVVFHRLPHGWGVRACADLWRLLSRERARTAVWQFVPQMFGWRGMKPCLAITMWLARLRGVSILTIAHEFQSPWGLRPGALVRAAVHRLNLRIVVAASRTIVATTPYCRVLLQRSFPRRADDVVDVPVPSPLPVAPCSGDARRAERAQLGAADGDLLIGTLGSPLDEPARELEALLRGALEVPAARVVVIGKDGNLLAERLRRGPAGARVAETGAVDEHRLSRILLACDVCVAVYPDGASTRRGSLAMALAHGVPFLANRGLLTDAWLEEAMCLFEPGDDARNALARLLRDPAERAELARRGRAAYEARLGWPVVTRALLAHLGKPPIDGPAPHVARVPWVCFVALFLATLPLVNPYVRGDGNGYYAYVRSAVIDGDLQFENEFRHADPAFRALIFAPDGTVKPKIRTATWHVWNQWSVGPALVWLPAFVAAHGAVVLARTFGAAVPADGYSWPYRVMCAFVTAACGFGAVLIGGKLAERFAAPGPARLAALSIWLASSLPIYMYFVPFHVHGIAALAVALFFAWWLRLRDREGRARDWLVWGALAGVMVLIYYLHVILWLIPAFELLRRGRFRVAHAAAFGGAAAVALMPHFVTRWILHGSPLTTGYQDEFFWTAPRVWQVAFSSEHGALLWTPILIPALAGWGLLWRRQRSIAVPLVATFSVFYLVVASYQNWHGLSAYGSRFLVSFTAPFVVGLAVTLDALYRRIAASHPRRSALSAAVAGALIACVAWNVGFAFQWGTNMINNRGPVDLRVVARNQVTVVPSRMAMFLRAYFTDRPRAVRDVEEQDAIEQRQYMNRR